MLLGFVLLGEAAGTYRISEIVALGQAGGLGGATVTTALALILVGALTESRSCPSTLGCRPRWPRRRP